VAVPPVDRLPLSRSRITWPGTGIRKVKRLIVHGSERQAEGSRKGRPRRFFLLVGNHDAIDTRLTSTTGSAKGDIKPHEVLQRQGDMRRCAVNTFPAPAVQ
jgi:hypothetical protein